jgi:ubiquinone/menaquinone biosynthesis C-methylase UbiE
MHLDVSFAIQYNNIHGRVGYSSPMSLPHSKLRAYYDWLGKKLDTQSFYENPALDKLIEHADFEACEQVFEFGCGTGRFAERLLRQHLPPSASYLGIDLSPVMAGIARRRLAPFGARARVECTDGSIQIPIPDHSVDRVIATYVLDLLREEDIRRFIEEASRVLIPPGLLCLSSLTDGATWPSRVVSTLWDGLYHISPTLVGGCRPIHPDAYIDPTLWHITYKEAVTPFAVPTVALIATPTGPMRSIELLSTAELRH